jgi:aminoglycoside phosphotransferase (APT) family kinase protein
VSDELEERLAAAASAHLGPTVVEELRPLPGGHSGLTWVAALRPSGAQPLDVVVKSTPPGRDPVGRHDVLRQARVLLALRDLEGVLVPEVHFSDRAAPPFFAMQLVEGESDEPAMDGISAEPPETIAALWEQALAMLARLHAAAPASLGLADGEPVYTPLGELERWRATVASAGAAWAARARPLLEALEREPPAPGPLALVHGDFRLGNMLRRDGRLRALIDWEIWSLGDARCDLGWLTLFAEAENFPGLGRQLPGTPEPEAVVARYGELAGAPVERMEWFRALAAFKLAAVQAHNLRRHREGRRHDPFLDRFEPAIERLLEAGLEQLGVTSRR